MIMQLVIMKLKIVFKQEKMEEYMQEQKTNTKINPLKKIINKRGIIVLIFLLLIIIASVIAYRGEYLEILELGQDYLSIFEQNRKYQYITSISLFLIVFLF